MMPTTRQLNRSPSTLMVATCSPAQSTAQSRSGTWDKAIFCIRCMATKAPRTLFNSHPQATTLWVVVMTPSSWFGNLTSINSSRKSSMTLVGERPLCALRRRLLRQRLPRSQSLARVAPLQTCTRMHNSSAPVSPGQRSVLKAISTATKSNEMSPLNLTMSKRFMMITAFPALEKNSKTHWRRLFRSWIWFRALSTSSSNE